MSAPIDFLTTYWPAVADIDPARVASIRAAQTLLVETAAPGIDTSPGTTLGDLHMTPAAWDKAATEVAWGRFASDLDPENVRKGTVFNCEFVRAYLSAFGQDPEAEGAWGLARLVFATNNPVTVDRSTVFLVARNEFQLGLPQAGPLYLNQTPQPGENHKTLVRIGADRWAVDVVLKGVTGSEGDSTTIRLDRDIEGLVEVTLVSSMQPGAEPTSLQEMARRLRSLNNCRQPVTRGGATGMVTTRFPEITAVSAVLSGDPEQVRDDLNPMLLPGGKLDLCVKSNLIVQERMTVRLTRSGTATPYYSGLLKFPSPAISVDSVMFGTTVVAGELIHIPTTELPGLSAAYTEHQQLFLRVPAGTVPSTLVGDALVADFEVTWQLDAAQSVVTEWLKSDDNKAAGINILPRWFTPYVIDSLDVWYNRKGGVVFDREKAREELLQKFNLHHLDSPAGAHSIGDILYWAGAHSVHRIVMTAHLVASPAAKWLGVVFVQPTDDATWSAFDADLITRPVRTVTELIGFDPTFANAPAAVAVGARNFSWKLSGSNLRLIERATV